MPASVKNLDNGIAVGLNKGRPIRKRKVVKRRPEHLQRGRATPTTKFVKEVIREVCGYAPYERHIQELLRNGLDKRALRLAKKRVGSHKRALRKRDEMAAVVASLRLKKEAESKE